MIDFILNLSNNFELNKDILIYGPVIVVTLIGIIAKVIVNVKMNKNKMDIIRYVGKPDISDDVQEEKEEATEEHIEEAPISDYDGYLRELDENINILCEYSNKVNNANMSKDIKAIVDNLRKVRKYTDNEEYKQGNLKKINSYYLKSLKKLIKSYIDLDNCGIKNSKVTSTKKEITDSIHDIVTVFSNLAYESIQKELLDASVDASTIKNVATVNGLMYQEGLHF